MTSSLLKKIVESGAHLLVAANSGDGGTTTLLGLIEVTRNIYSQEAQFFVISPINKKWMGLERVRYEYKVNNVITTSPAVVYPFGINVKTAIDQINVVYEIMTQRMKYKQEQTTSHIFLIVDEWQGLYGAMKQCEKETYNITMFRLSEIICKARQYNIRVVLKVNSLFVADLGFTTSVISCFSVLLQDRSGGQYQTIKRAMRNRSIIDPAQISSLNQQLEQICRNIADNSQFIALSTVEKPTIAVLPNWSDLKDKVLFGQI